jgi:predicted phage baseplate assembly protein
VLAQMTDADAPVRGQTVALTDATGVAYEATVLSAAQAPDIPGAVAISVSPAPATPLKAASALLLGNVVRASQGETVTSELLGSGDATIAGQRLALGKPPITYVPAPGAAHGGNSTLVVRVAGVQWSEREDLYGAGPGDRVFVVEREDDGTCLVRFGDGVLGARLPSGAQVTAEYRTGLGSAGNVAAGALRLPLTRPTGLVSVFNPIAAGAGADPETLEQARANAPNTVRTFDRIVSLRDVEDQARANALVGKASASWIALGSEPGVVLTVAGSDGEVLGLEQMRELRADLDARRDPNRVLEIRSYAPLALSIGVRVIALEADLRSEDVEADVQAALLAHFAFDAREFGQPVRLSEAFVAAQNAPGVIGVDVDELTLVDPVERSSHQLSSAPVQSRIDLAPNELATLAAVDLRVTVP